MEPLTPGMTIVAEAMTPITNSTTSCPRLSVMAASCPLPSPRICRRMTSANAAMNAATPATPFFSPFVRARITGRPPKIRPMNARFVCSGKVPSR